MLTPDLAILGLVALIAAITWWIGTSSTRARYTTQLRHLERENTDLADQVDTLLDTVNAYRRHLDAVTAPTHPARGRHLRPINGSAS